MKNSGIEWIGEIPDDWNVIKIKYILTANDGGIWGKDPINSQDDKIVLRSTEQTIDGLWNINNPAIRDLSGFQYQKYLIRPNDLLITKSSGSSLHIGKTTLADEYFISHECYYSNFLQRLSVKEFINAKFIWYIFNSVIAREQFVYLQNSTSGIGNINAENIDNIIVPYLSLELQNNIVNYLDKKCAAVDKLIANQQGQIEKLKEYKQAIITEAVTKGLNPSAPMKDSGVEWIGNIPYSYQMTKIKNIGIYFNGLTYSPNDITDENKGTLVLRSSNIKNGKLVLDDNVYVSCDIRKNLMVEKGDILVCSRNGSRNLIGKNAIIDKDICCSFGAFMMIFRCECSKYMYYILNSNIFTYYLGSFFTATINQLTGQNFGNMAVPFCSNKEEQQQIADYLDNKCGQIDKLISIKQEKIEKLNEYKKSLIYEYVTGKKEVG